MPRTSKSVSSDEDGSGTVSSNTSTSARLAGWTACWNQRTLPEKLLFSVILFIFIGFIVAMIVLVEIYLRLEDRLLTAGINKPGNLIITDDTPSHQSFILSNLTQLPEYCLTIECVEASARILTALDPLADPCDDMAAFACGGWSQRQVQTPNAKDVVMVLENLQSRVDHQIKLVLEAPPHPADLKAYGKLRTYFASCMAEGQDQARHASVREVMTELGQMMNPADWSKAANQWDLTSLLIKVLQVNGAPLFDVAVQVDDRNTSRYVISVGLPRQSGVVPSFYSPIPQDLLNFVSQMDSSSDVNEPHHGSRQKRQFNQFADNPSDNRDETPESVLDSLGTLPSLLNNADPDLGLFIPDANFLSSIQQLSRDQKAVAAFRLMQDSGAFANFTEDQFQLDQITIKQVMSSIDQLAPSDRDRKLSQQSIKILNYFTVQQLQEKFGFINWAMLLKEVMEVEIKPDVEVIVHYPDVLQQLQTIVTISDKRILHNTILMLVVRDLALELFKAPPGMDKWSFCLQAAKGGFGEVMSGLYLQQFPPSQLDNYRQKSEEMFNSLKESVVEMIQQSEWPDHFSKRKALRKAKNLRPHLVAPDMFFNATFLESLASQVEIDGLDFVAATWKLYKLFRKDFFAIYSRPVDETTVIWQLLAYPMIANAFYLQHFNSMVLPLALLHDPLFSLETPRYLGLGTLGFIVAHEIMHGFDSSGVEFDDDGRRKPLLAPATQKIFEEKMNCVSEQYSNVFQTEFGHNGSSIILKVDGQLTLNENVADLGAIKAIVSTLARMEKEKGPAQSLPGLSRYTNEQLMLINAAQAYCALINPQAYALIIGMDEHTPPHDRVNGFMMNLPDYERIFNCPAGTRVNPKTRCSVW